MRTLLLSVVCGLWSVVLCSGQMLIDPYRFTVSAGSCSTPDWGDELDEGFQGTDNNGYENTWTEVGSTNYLDPDFDSSSLTSGNYTNLICDESLSLDATSCAGTETYITWDRGSAIVTTNNDIDITFWLYVDSLTSGDVWRLVSVGSSSPLSGVCLTVGLQNSSGTVRLVGDGFSGITNIGLDQWYKVRIHMDTTPAESFIQVNDGTENTFTRAAGASARYFGFGATSDLDAADEGVIYMDLISINTP